MIIIHRTIQYTQLITGNISTVLFKKDPLHDDPLQPFINCMVINKEMCMKTEHWKISEGKYYIKSDYWFISSDLISHLH